MKALTQGKSDYHLTGEMPHFKVIGRLAVLLAGLLVGLVIAPQRAAAVLLYDDMSNFENGALGANIAVTEVNPNTFMGDGYVLLTNATRITGFDLYPANVSSTTFSGLQMTIYVWGSVNQGTVNGSAPAFSNLLAVYVATAAGEFDPGFYYPFEGSPVGLAPGLTVSTPLVITSTNIGITFNYQGTTDTLIYSNVNNLTSLIVYGTLPSTGANDFNGNYVNTTGETDGNFTNTFSSFSVGEQTLAVRVYGSVAGPNHAPVANSQSLYVLTNSPASITLTASDVDGDPLTYSVVSSPTHGHLTGTPPAVVYTPNANYVGNDSFTFEANDGITNSAPATISLSVVASAGLIINPIWDTTILSDANVLSITNTIMTAIRQLELRYANPVTVSIQFDEMTTGLGQSQTWISTVPYSSYYNALVASAATTNDAVALAHLPGGSTEPVTGGTQVEATLPLLRCLGFTANPPSGQADSIISVNMSIINVTRPPADPTKYDLQAVVSHEMDEVLGTSSAVGQTTIEAADLFRYTAEGGRTFTTAGDDAYFSIDGGATLLARYNEVAGGDYGDWWSFSPHTPVRIQDAYGTPGTDPDFTVEPTLLDSVGWTLVTALPSVVPVMQPPKLSGATLNLSWTSISNKSYQVQSTTNLAQSAWVNLGSSILASGTLTTNSDTLTGVKKYYRIQVLNSQALATLSPSSKHPIVSGPFTLSTHVHQPHPAIATSALTGATVVAPTRQPIPPQDIFGGGQ